MKHLGTLFLAAILAAALSCSDARAQDALTAITPGTASVRVDGVVHRVPAGATHWKRGIGFHTAGAAPLEEGVQLYRLPAGARTFNGKAVPAGATHFFMTVEFARKPANPPSSGISGHIEEPRPIQPIHTPGSGEPTGPIGEPTGPVGEPGTITQPRPDPGRPSGPTGPLGEEPGTGSPGTGTPGTLADDPTQGVPFRTWKAAQNRSNRGWGPVLTEIVNHLPRSYGNTYYDSDPVTFGHETTHGINSHLRNHLNDTGKRVNGFYLLDDQYVLLEEPRMRKRAVGPYVPRSLRESRFAFYVTGSPAWDDTPTYILDEWVAYVNGAAVGVDMAKNGLWNKGWRDSLGQLEFTVYSLALARAVQRERPEYWQAHPEFNAFIAWNAQRAMETYRASQEHQVFRWDKQDAYLRNLRGAADAEDFRSWIRQTYGADWTKQVFGF